MQAALSAVSPSTLAAISGAAISYATCKASRPTREDMIGGGILGAGSLLYLGRALQDLYARTTEGINKGADAVQEFAASILNMIPGLGPIAAQALQGLKGLLDGLFGSVGDAVLMALIVFVLYRYFLRR